MPSLKPKNKNSMSERAKGIEMAKTPIGERLEQLSQRQGEQILPDLKDAVARIEGPQTPDFANMSRAEFEAELAKVPQSTPRKE
jgi:hypothetical protein